MYCYLEVFGSHFKAEDFSCEINIQDAIVRSQIKAYPRSPVKALRKGNVNSWKTPKKYYKGDKDDFINPFNDYLYEEKFMIRYIEGFYNFKNLLLPYRSDTTEVWFHAIYSILNESSPTGVFFGNELIKALSKIEASISTDVVFIDSK